MSEVVTQAQELLEKLPRGIPANRSSAEAACLIAARIAQFPNGDLPPVVAINGAQGSGKSTLTQLVGLALEQFHDLRPALLSLDDFYLGKPPRYQLERQVHPLCATRGVPGTHDVALMRETFASLRHASPEQVTPLPAFDKLDDDRMPREEWASFTGRPDVILLEGWCVGLRAEDVPAWTGPINALEAEEDPHGAWFAWSLRALAEDYPAIWDQIDLLVSIEVPDFETVISSRLQQEEGLAARGGRPRMDRPAITRFVQHYERYTRALWDAMPRCADMLLRRDKDFGFTLLRG